MSYGIPYQGSKNKIIKEICGMFPKADHFYDLFGGGFSVTHFMLQHRAKDFKEFHFNEIRTGMPEFIKWCINGFYSYANFKPEWISRERFYAEKENDLYIKVCWSFGNNGEDYLFGKEIEGYKRSLHQAIIFNEFDDTAKETLGISAFKDGISIYDRRMFLWNRVTILNKDRSYGELQKKRQLEQLEQLQRLQRLQRLERLERLQRLERLHFHNTSFEQVEIKPDSVVYCDIPYQGTHEYDGNKNFNRAKFFEWARALKEPLFISEYNVNESGFRQVWSKRVKSSMSGRSMTEATERVYCNEIAYKILSDKFYKKVSVNLLLTQ